MASTLSGPTLNPVTTTADRKWFQYLPIQFDPDYLEFMDDFQGIVLNATNDWTVVKDSGASVALAADIGPGRVLLTSAATTDDDGASIQGNEIFLPAADKRIWFETKLQGSLVADMDIFVGLVQNFATDPEAVLTASNRIGFQVNDGNASIICKCEATDVETSKDSEIDMVDATDIILGLVVIGITLVEYYVNRVLVATHTTNIPVTEMALAAFELSGSATGTRSLSIDYIFAAKQR